VLWARARGREEQVDDGQLKSGERGRCTSILEDSWGSERPWKKGSPIWKRGGGWGVKEI